MFSKEIINFFLLPLYVLSPLKCSHCEAQRERERERGDRRELANPQLLMPFNCPQFSFNLESSPCLFKLLIMYFLLGVDNAECRLLIAVKAVSYVRTLSSDVPHVLLDNLQYSSVSITFLSFVLKKNFIFFS